MIKPIAFCHSADFDGICSGEIIRRYYNGNVDIYPINHGEPVPFNLIKDRVVIISDFSFKGADFSKVVNLAKEVIWLDHHKSAIDEIKKLNFYSKIKGFQSTLYSGAELTWLYFFNDKTIPDCDDYIHPVIRLLGRYDSWRFQESEKDYVFAFQYGLKSRGTTFGSPIWNDLLIDIEKNVIQQNNSGHLSFKLYELIDEIIKNGNTINTYYKLYLNLELNKRLGRSIVLNVNGKSFNVYAMNAPMTFSESFLHGYDEKLNDVCMSYYQRADGKWSYSIYVQKDKNIDGSIISKSSGGGGQRSASGFQTDKLIKELL